METTVQVHSRVFKESFQDLDTSFFLKGLFGSEDVDDKVQQYTEEHPSSSLLFAFHSC